MDEGGLAIEVDGRIRSGRVIEVLSRVISERSVPLDLRSDNGPELVVRALLKWMAEHGIETALTPTLSHRLSVPHGGDQVRPLRRHGSQARVQWLCLFRHCTDDIGNFSGPLAETNFAMDDATSPEQFIGTCLTASCHYCKGTGVARDMLPKKIRQHAFRPNRTITWRERPDV